MKSVCLELFEVRSIKSLVWFSLYGQIIRLKFRVLGCFYLKSTSSLRNSCFFETFLNVKCSKLFLVPFIFPITGCCFSSGLEICEKQTLPGLVLIKAGGLAGGLGFGMDPDLWPEAGSSREPWAEDEGEQVQAAPAEVSSLCNKAIFCSEDNQSLEQPGGSRR